MRFRLLDASCNAVQEWDAYKYNGSTYSLLVVFGSSIRHDDMVTIITAASIPRLKQNVISFKLN